MATVRTRLASIPGLGRSLPLLIPLSILLLLPAGAGAQDNISELAIIYGGGSSIPPPTGYTKVNVDLNRGAGGDFIYVCYKRGFGAPVTGIATTLGGGSPPAGRAWTKIDVDLNRNAGGDLIYLWYTKDPGCSTLKDIVVLLNSEPAPPGYTKISVDLNRNAGGDFIYFAYRQD